MRYLKNLLAAALLGTLLLGPRPALAHEAATDVRLTVTGEEMRLKATTEGDPYSRADFQYRLTDSAGKVHNGRFTESTSEQGAYTAPAPDAGGGQASFFLSDTRRQEAGTFRAEQTVDVAWPPQGETQIHLPQLAKAPDEARSPLTTAAIVLGAALLGVAALIFFGRNRRTTAGTA
jgi:hypothetical protein